MTERTAEPTHMSFPDSSNHARANAPHRLGKFSLQMQKQPFLAVAGIS